MSVGKIIGISACIGTVTAFVVTAVPRLLGDYGQSLFLWLAPAVVIVPILQTMTTYYRKKLAFSQKAAGT